MTTALYTLRALQIGIRISELELLTMGDVYDICTEGSNDHYAWRPVASQDDFDAFSG